MNNWGRFEAVEGRHCNSHAGGANGAAVPQKAVGLLYVGVCRGIVGGIESPGGSIDTAVGLLQQQKPPMMPVAEKGGIVRLEELGSRPRTGC